MGASQENISQFCQTLAPVPKAITSLKMPTGQSPGDGYAPIIAGNLALCFAKLPDPCTGKRRNHVFLEISMVDTPTTPDFFFYLPLVVRDPPEPAPASHAPTLTPPGMGGGGYTYNR